MNKAYKLRNKSVRKIYQAKWTYITPLVPWVVLVAAVWAIIQ